MVITGQNGTNCINCNPPPAGCSANGTWTDNSCNPPAIGLWNLNAECFSVASTGVMNCCVAGGTFEIILSCSDCNGLSCSDCNGQHP
jgi:hypothetical protein